MQPGDFHDLIQLCCENSENVRVVAGTTVSPVLTVHESSPHSDLIPSPPQTQGNTKKQ